jgi:hypothetical protein
MLFLIYANHKLSLICVCPTLKRADLLIRGGLNDSPLAATWVALHKLVVAMTFEAKVPRPGEEATARADSAGAEADAGMLPQLLPLRGAKRGLPRWPSGEFGILSKRRSETGASGVASTDEGAALDGTLFEYGMLVDMVGGIALRRAGLALRILLVSNGTDGVRTSPACTLLTELRALASCRELFIGGRVATGVVGDWATEASGWRELLPGDRDITCLTLDEWAIASSLKSAEAMRAARDAVQIGDKERARSAPTARTLALILATECAGAEGGQAAEVALEGAHTTGSSSGMPATQPILPESLVSLSPTNDITSGVREALTPAPLPRLSPDMPAGWKPLSQDVTASLISDSEGVRMADSEGDRVVTTAELPPDTTEERCAEAGPAEATRRTDVIMGVLRTGAGAATIASDALGFMGKGTGGCPAVTARPLLGSRLSTFSMSICSVL